MNANWRDNPWFPSVLEDERKTDLLLYPDRYDHVWEGDYVRAFEGAYFAQMLVEARAQGGIGKVAADPLLPLRAFHRHRRLRRAVAGTAFTIWVVQWVGAGNSRCWIILKRSAKGSHFASTRCAANGYAAGNSIFTGVGVE